MQGQSNEPQPGADAQLFESLGRGRDVLQRLETNAVNGNVPPEALLAWMAKLSKTTDGRDALFAAMLLYVWQGKEDSSPEPIRAFRERWYDQQDGGL